MKPSVAIVILAAGHSSRMRGRDKLAEMIAGRALLSWVSDRALATDAECYAVLPSPSHPRRQLIGAVQPVFVTGRAEGIGHSIASGIGVLSQAEDGAMILPADMPEIDTADMQRVIRAFEGPQGPIVQATTAAGKPGHPVLFPRRLFPKLRLLRGDFGARAILQKERVTPVALPGDHATRDLDTPEDWVTWRKSVL